MVGCMTESCCYELSFLPWLTVYHLPVVTPGITTAIARDLFFIRLSCHGRSIPWYRRHAYWWTLVVFRQNLSLGKPRDWFCRNTTCVRRYAYFLLMESLFTVLNRNYHGWKEFIMVEKKWYSCKLAMVVIIIWKAKWPTHISLYREFCKVSKLRCYQNRNKNN